MLVVASASALQPFRPATAPSRKPGRRITIASAAARQGEVPSAAPAAAAAAAPLEAATKSSKCASRRAALVALVASISAVKAGAAAANENAPRDGEVRHSDEEWRQMLNPAQYAVLRRAATERRFSSPLVDEHRTGTFSCAGCGLPLFASQAKYESGTGWPSFFDALPSAVALERDNSIPFMPRVEVRCRRCLGHLGHVFDDGPAPTGLRYCMNGAALDFKPQEA